MGLVDVGWINLAQNMSIYHGFRKKLMKFCVPPNIGNFLTRDGIVSF